MGISPLMVPIVLFIMTGVTAIGIPIAKAYARRIEREPRQPVLPPDVGARLERNTAAAPGLSKPPS
jgi:hypothetical protein